MDRDFGTACVLTACGGDQPQLEEASFETMTVKKQNMTIPVKFSANLKAAQLTEQNLQKKYVQTVIDAGKEVNKAMAQCQAAHEKQGYYHRQVQVLHEAFVDTHYLMESGDASYLEVLTAQESFLSAQLHEAENLYDGAQAVIALYIALGGGTK